MPSSNLAAYLAKNYLTASNSSEQHGSSDFQDSTRPKKKRRKNKDPSADSGLIIADDDEALTLKGSSTRNRDDEDGDMPIYDTNVKSAEFRKKKGGSGWKVIAQPDTNTTTTTTAAAEDDEADRILAAAAEEADARRREIEDEDAPAIVDTQDAANMDDSTPRMSSGAKAGLQTAADTARLVEREERERERELAREQQRKKKSSSSSRKEETQPAEETIYRDATGRRIDISMKRAEARAAEEEKRRAERQAREDAMGDVQRREKESRKQDLEEAKFLTLGRGADDEDMNEDLRRAVRWDDPMAAYMAQKQAEEEQQHGTVTGSSASAALAARRTGNPRKKVYVGAAPPNRYGISPGWRWDGVDRSNGFEKEWFQARSRKGRNADLEYQWQMDE
ncbi:Pre-mRNA-splicing factor cwc26 [Rhinocladiella similis]